MGLLEAALEREFNPNGDAHGIDREDSIDLSKIINEIPGKSPGQVSAAIAFISTPSVGCSGSRVASALRTMHTMCSGRWREGGTRTIIFHPCFPFALLRLPLTKVLHFYHRYLAAARPLIDIVYGPEVGVSVLRPRMIEAWIAYFFTA